MTLGIGDEGSFPRRVGLSVGAEVPEALSDFFANCVISWPEVSSETLPSNLHRRGNSFWDFPLVLGKISEAFLFESTTWSLDGIN